MLIGIDRTTVAFPPWWMQLGEKQISQIKVMPNGQQLKEFKTKLKQKLCNLHFWILLVAHYLWNKDHPTGKETNWSHHRCKPKWNPFITNRWTFLALHDNEFNLRVPLEATLSMFNKGQSIRDSRQNCWKNKGQGLAVPGSIRDSKNKGQ